MGKNRSVVSKQQLSDKFLNGFLACEETPIVEKTIICLEADVDAIWQVNFYIRVPDDEED